MAGKRTQAALCSLFFNQTFSKSLAGFARRGKSAQAALEYIVVVGGIIVLATSSYFILRSQVQETGATAVEAESEAFQLLLEEARLITSTGTPRVKLWFDEYSSNRLRVTVTNPFGYQIDSSTVLVPAPKGYAGSIRVTYMNDEGNEVLTSAYVDELAGCEMLDESDEVFFTVENLGPYESRDYYVYYDDSTDCDYTSVSHDNLYLFGEDTDGDKPMVFSNITRGSAYFLPDLIITGAGQITEDITQNIEPGFTLDTESFSFPSSEAVHINLDSDDGNGNTDFVIETTRKLVFQSSSTVRKYSTFFSEDKNIVFYVPPDVETFTLKLESFDTGVNRVKIYYPSGGTFDSGFIQGTWNPLLEAKETDRGKRWTMDLPANSTILFEDIPNYFSLDMEAFFVPDLKFSNVLNVTVADESRPDSNPPYVGAIVYEPKEPTSSDQITVLVGVTDESNLSACYLQASGTVCETRCLMSPVVGDWESGLSGDVRLFLDIGKLTGDKSYIMNVTCEDIWGNVGSLSDTLFVQPGPDETGPVVSISLSPLQDGFLMSSEPYSVTVKAEDQTGVESCMVIHSAESEPHEMEKVSEEGKVSVWNYTYTEPPQADATYVFSAKCTDTSDTSRVSTSSLSVSVKDTTEPVIRSTEFYCTPSDNCNPEERWSYVYTEMYVSIQVTDNSKVDKCYTRYDIESSDETVWSDYQEASCRGCGTELAAASGTYFWTEEGQYGIQIKCDDLYGNPTLSEMDLALRESNPPEIDSSSLSPQIPTTSDGPFPILTLTLTGVTDDTGIASCWADISGTESMSIGLTETSEETYTAELSDLKAGPYSIAFDCADEEGHKVSEFISERMYSHTFDVDGSSPVIDSFQFSDSNKRITVKAHDPYDSVASCKVRLDRDSGLETYSLSLEGDTWTASIPSFTSLTLNCTDTTGWPAISSYTPFRLSLSIPSGLTDCNWTVEPNYTIQGEASCSLILKKDEPVSESPLGAVTLFDPEWGEHRLSLDYQNSLTLSCTDSSNYSLSETQTFAYSNTLPSIEYIESEPLIPESNVPATIRISAQDCSLVKSCSVSFDNKQSWETANITPSPSAAASLEHTFPIPGDHEAWVKCIDAGGSSTEQSTTVSVLDSEGPVFTGFQFLNNNQRIEVTVIDLESGVTSVSITAGSEEPVFLSPLDANQMGNGVWYSDSFTAEGPLVLTAINGDSYSSIYTYHPPSPFEPIAFTPPLVEGLSLTDFQIEYANNLTSCTLAIGDSIFSNPLINKTSRLIAFKNINPKELPLEFTPVITCTDSHNWIAVFSPDEPIVRPNNPPAMESDALYVKDRIGYCEEAPAACTSREALIAVEVSDVSRVEGCTLESGDVTFRDVRGISGCNTFPFVSGTACFAAVFEDCAGTSGCAEPGLGEINVTCTDDDGVEGNESFGIKIADTTAPDVTGITIESLNANDEWNGYGVSTGPSLSCSGIDTCESPTTPVDFIGSQEVPWAIDLERTEYISAFGSRLKFTITAQEEGGSASVSYQYSACSDAGDAETCSEWMDASSNVIEISYAGLYGASEPPAKAKIKFKVTDSSGNENILAERAVLLFKLDHVGDGACDQSLNEYGGKSPVDCAEVCGDQFCSNWEKALPCSQCEQDCPCPSGHRCCNGVCTSIYTVFNCLSCGRTCASNQGCSAWGCCDLDGEDCVNDGDCCSNNCCADEKCHSRSSTAPACGGCIPNGERCIEPWGEPKYLQCRHCCSGYNEWYVCSYKPTTPVTPACTGNGQWCMFDSNCCCGRCKDWECDPPSCFPAGTKILMADGSEKNIEEISVGDMVMGYDGQKNAPVTVLGLESPIRDHLYTLTFSDGSSLRLTDEHPLYTLEGWKSLSPEETAGENAELKVGVLEAGDSVLSSSGEYLEIVSIEYVSGRFQTYNLKTVSAYNNFYADGLLAHNKGNGDCLGTLLIGLPSIFAFGYFLLVKK